MRSQKLTFIVFGAVFLATMAGAIKLQNELIWRRRQEPFRFHDSLYLPDSRYVEAISLGYNHFVADFLWLRMIQSFAAGWSLPENKGQMKAYFDVITDLDPRFLDVYSFAIMALGEEGNKDGKFDPLVIETVEKATVRNPRDSKVPYEGAFYAFWNMKDADLAKYFVRVALKDPNHPDHMARWEGYFDLQQGRFQAAYDKYFADTIEAVRDKNDVTISILLNQLERAVNLWISDTIKSKAIEFHKAQGRYPTIDELRAGGYFQNLQIPNWPGIKNILDQGLAGQIAMPESRDEINQIAKQAIRTWSDLPPGPYDTRVPGYSGYVIWPGSEPENERFVLSTAEALVAMQRIAKAATHNAQQYRDEHNGQAAPDLATLNAEFAKEVDAFGKPWVYDPVKCEVTSASVPDLLTMQLPDF